MAKYAFIYTHKKLQGRIKDRRLLMNALSDFEHTAVLSRNDVGAMQSIPASPDEIRFRFMKAEQFVLDLRGYTDEELEDIHITYSNLYEAGLHYYPCNDFIVHLISDDEDLKVQMLNSFLALNMLDPKGHYDKEGGKSTRFQILLCEENDYGYLNAYANANGKTVVHLGLRALRALLATKGIIKEKKGQSVHPNDAFNTRIVKTCGSACYTYIRRPTAQELGAQSGSTVRPHFRRGHLRNIGNEQEKNLVWVSPCFVNGEPVVPRTAYIV